MPGKTSALVYCGFFIPRNVPWYDLAVLVLLIKSVFLSPNYMIDVLKSDYLLNKYELLNCKFG